MYDAARTDWESGDKVFDIIGFSRGAVRRRVFAFANDVKSRYGNNSGILKVAVERIR